MKGSDRNEMDPELDSFLSRVEELDAERSMKGSPTKRKTEFSKTYTDDDLRVAEDLLNGSYENKDRYEMNTNALVTPLTFKSAYNFDKTFSPKKMSSNEGQNDNLRRSEFNHSTSPFNLKNIKVSKFDDIHTNILGNENMYIISREDYEILQKVKRNMSADMTKKLLSSSIEERTVQENFSRMDIEPSNQAKGKVKSSKPPLLPKKPSLSSFTVSSTINRANLPKQDLQTIEQRQTVEKLQKDNRKSSPPEVPKKKQDLEKLMKFNLIDKPTDDVKQRSILIEGKKNLSTSTKEYPKQNTKFLETRFVASRPAIKPPSSDLCTVNGHGTNDKPEAINQLQKLTKPKMPEQKRNITPEAIRARTNLTRPVVPPKPKIDIPEAILRRSTLNKPPIPPKPQLEVPEALLKRNSLNKISIKSNSTSKSFPYSEKTNFQAALEKHIKNKIPSNAQHSIETGIASTKSNKGAISATTPGSTSTKAASLTKKRDRGPKRKLPSSVINVNK